MSTKKHRAAFGLTTREKRACFKHAKEHVIEVLVDLCTDEHHSVFMVDGKNRSDMHVEVMKHLERYLRDVRLDTFGSHLMRERSDRLEKEMRSRYTQGRRA